MKTRIIVDSTLDMNPALKDKVTVVPLTVHFGDEEYIDGVTITNEEFYEKLTTDKNHPTTSQATPERFMKVFEALKEDEEAVVITLSPKFSGTCQSALIAAEQYDNIYVVDSGSVANGGGILAELAIELVNSGKSAKEIKEILDKEKEKIVIVALLDTLEYLKRGGRISKTVAFAGTLLNIKPVLSVIDGEIEMLGKARGSKQGTGLLVSEIEKCGGMDFDKPVLLGYTGKDDSTVLNYIEDSKYIWEGKVNTVPYTTIGSVIGTHAGPGAIIVSFFKK